MKRRNSRHGIFIERIVSAINNGENPRALLESSAFISHRLTPARVFSSRRLTSGRANSEVTSINSWSRASKRYESKRSFAANLDKKSKFVKTRNQLNNGTTTTGDHENITIPTTSKDYRDLGASMMESPEPNKTGDGTGGAVTPPQNTTDANSVTTSLPALDFKDDSSTITPPIKLKKHIRPCACDLTPAQLARILALEDQRKKSRHELAERLRSIKEYLNRKSISPKPATRPDSKSPEEEEQDFFREEIERVKIIKKKQKRVRKPRIVQKPVRKRIQRKRKKRVPKIIVGKKLKLNWKKPPKIPIRPTRTSTVRETKRGYCGCIKVESPPPPPLDDFKIRFDMANSPVVKESKTSSLRLRNAKSRIPPPSPPLKHDRPPFEANPHVYKHLKPLKANTE